MHLRQRDYLYQRGAGPVEIQQRDVIEVNLLGGIFFKMSLFDADSLSLAIDVYFDKAVSSDRMELLGYLETLGKIRIEIIFAVKIKSLGYIHIQSL